MIIQSNTNMCTIINLISDLKLRIYILNGYKPKQFSILSSKSLNEKM